MKRVFVLLFIGIFFAVPNISWAKYPKKEIKLIIPFRKGGETDIISRMFARSLSETTGIKINVESIHGGRGSDALKYLLNAKPDGYTLFMHRNDIGWSDPLKINNYEVIAMVATHPFVTYVLSKNKIKSLSDLKPKQAKTMRKFVGSTPIGLTVGVKLEGLMKEELFPIISNSRGNTFDLLMRKDIDFWIAPLDPGLIKSGVIDPIAVFSDRSFNDIPTARSQGFDIQNSLNYAVIAPRGTPKDKIEILNQKFQMAIDNLANVKKGKNIGVEFGYRDGAYYTKSTMGSYNDFCNLCVCDKSLDCKITCKKCK